MEYFSGKPRNAGFHLSNLMDDNIDTHFKSRVNENIVKNPFFRLNLIDNHIIFGLVVIGSRKFTPNNFANIFISINDYPDTMNSTLNKYYVENYNNDIFPYKHGAAHVFKFLPTATGKYILIQVINNDQVKVFSFSELYVYGSKKGHNKVKSKNFLIEILF